MSEVYENAICNIAAAGADDSAGGLFFEGTFDETLPHSPGKIDINWQEIVTGTFYAVDTSYWMYHVTNTLLIQRA